ncbi:MAG TPA: aminoglycoside phosphotransferase family protein [Xanthobacteraceae bacterium]|nr:aminoglycoside phosphotransferase family protein [Xanthobacteraceae bacterium]
MTVTIETPDRLLDRTLAFVADRFGGPIEAGEPVAAVMSPMHRAVDADCRVIHAAGRTTSYFLKIWHDDLVAPPDPTAVFTAAQAAAEAGVAPAALLLTPDQRAVLYEHLGAGWRTARLNELAEPATLEALIVAKAAIHRLSPFPRDRDVFADIEALAQTAPRRGAYLPADFANLLAAAAHLRLAVAASGIDRVPAHADGVASNVMLGPGGAVRLVDFDEAGNTDALFDLAVTLNEIFPLDEPRQAEVLEAFAGTASPAALARLRAYGLADDLKWALWGFIMDATSPRRDIEFLKYAQWRWLRGNMALSRWSLDATLRAI